MEPVGWYYRHNVLSIYSIYKVHRSIIYMYLWVGDIDEVTDASLLPQVGFEVSVLHEGEDEVGTLAVWVQAYPLHPQDVGVGEGAHDRALLEEIFELVVG